MASHGRRSGRGDRSRGAGGCGRRRARRRSGCGAPSTMGDIDAMTNRGGGGGGAAQPPHPRGAPQGAKTSDDITSLAVAARRS